MSDPFVKPSFLRFQTAARKLRDVVEKRATTEDLTAVLAQIKQVTDHPTGAWSGRENNNFCLRDNQS